MGWIFNFLSLPLNPPQRSQESPPPPPTHCPVSPIKELMKSLASRYELHQLWSGYSKSLWNACFVHVVDLIKSKLSCDGIMLSSLGVIVLAGRCKPHEECCLELLMRTSRSSHLSFHVLAYSEDFVFCFSFICSRCFRFICVPLWAFSTTSVIFQ